MQACERTWKSGQRSKRKARGTRRVGKAETEHWRRDQSREDTQCSVEPKEGQMMSAMGKKEQNGRKWRGWWELGESDTASTGRRKGQ